MGPTPNIFLFQTKGPRGTEALHRPSATRSASGVRSRPRGKNREPPLGEAPPVPGADVWVPTSAWNRHFLLRTPAGPWVGATVHGDAGVHRERGALGDSLEAELAAPRAPRVPELRVAGFGRPQKPRSQRRA